METKNAIIESATITSDDHGCLSARLMLDYGGSDGCYEGPIMDEQIEDVRKNSGAWTPLYARHNA